MADIKGNVLVTGVAGFIGSHTARHLLREGWNVTGIDSMNAYYDPTLKLDRLKTLQIGPHAERFRFLQMDLADAATLRTLKETGNFSVVVHLAAQAGVRYSLSNPEAYTRSNIDGFLNILELCRSLGSPHLIYASSSSVYGLNASLPFSEAHPVDHPISLYAATKKANELMAHSYSHLFKFPSTGLRFFTVYGPWGRPDMAMFHFATSILEGKAIRLFNGGDMMRDFTYVDDVVESIVRLCSTPAKPDPAWDAKKPLSFSSSAPWKIYNIGNHSPILVSELVACMERLLGKKAVVHFDSIQPGDVERTFADVDRLLDAVDFQPKTSIEKGLQEFLDWLVPYREQRLATGKNDFGSVTTSG